MNVTSRPGLIQSGRKRAVPDHAIRPLTGAITEALSGVGVQTVEAHSAEQGLGLARQLRPALAFVSNTLPDGDTADVIRQLQIGGRRMPAILLLPNGPDEVLTEPISAEQIPACGRAVAGQGLVSGQGGNLVDERHADLVSLIQNETANPLDRSAALHTLQERTGYTQGQIAGLVGFSARQVRRLSSLLTLPADIQEGLRAGWITMAHVQLLQPLSPDKQEHWYRMIQEQRLSVRDLRAQLQADKQAPPTGIPSADTPSRRASAAPSREQPPTHTAPPNSLLSAPAPITDRPAVGPGADRSAAPPTGAASPAAESLSMRDKRRLALLQAARPGLPADVAESMIRHLRAKTSFAALVLDPLDDALDSLPGDTTALTGSQCATLLVLLDELQARLAALRAEVQANLRRIETAQS